MIKNHQLGLGSGLQQSMTDTQSQKKPDSKNQPDLESQLAWQHAMHGKENKHTVSNGDHKIPAVIQQDLLASLDSILVSDDAQANEVRITLKDASFKGLSVKILKEEGRILFCFTCELDAVKHKFDASAPNLAQHLANRLDQDVLVQVQTSNNSDLRLIEATATPQK